MDTAEDAIEELFCLLELLTSLYAPKPAPERSIIEITAIAKYLPRPVPFGVFDELSLAAFE